MRWRGVVVAAVLLSAGCAGSDGELYPRLRRDVVHLANGDSVEVQAEVPVVAPDVPPGGRMLVFHPFRPLADSARVRETAIALFRHARPRLDSAPPPFVVLRAVSLPAAARRGVYGIQYYGVVVERGAAGGWYLVAGSARHKL